MPSSLAPTRRRVRPSVSRRDLIPELGITAGTIAVTTAVHLLIIVRLGQSPPLFLFAAAAAGVTFWRGLGPGMLASSMGSAVGAALYAAPLGEFVHHKESAPLETALLFGGSMFICWLIYQLRADQEDTQAVRARQSDALAFVSHELRQPLSNIKLAAAILERDPSEERRSRAMHLIVRSATRLGNVIDDLADLTRVQASALRIDHSSVHLQKVVLTAVDVARPIIEQKQQFLEIDIPEDPPLWISADSMRLEQVLGNLLSNASKYSPEGGEISVSLRAEPGRAAVLVRDTGVGIRRDMLDAIFEPFVRDSTGGAEGLGIGLTVARYLVTQHGGRLAAHSEGPGRGSTFVIDLPLSSPTGSDQLEMIGHA